MLTLVKPSSPLELFDAHDETYRMKESFKLFAQGAWRVIEPGKKYVPGWHLDAIAEHLQAVIEGDIKRLLVNMPPRHGKSSFISTLIHPWSWLQNPSLRWLCASFAMNLAIRDNLKCRRIIRSPWWQDRWGHLFKLMKDMDAKTKFENDRTGYRMVVSVGSSGTTGEGGDILCMLYNTDVTTDRGRLKIGDIVERKLPVRILAFDHETNSPRWQSIEKYEVHPGRSCVRVTFSDGRTVDATTDHPFYVIGKGYIPAAELTCTDEVITDEGFLSNLRERNRSSTGAPRTRQKGHILQSYLPRSMADGREQSRLSGGQGSIGVRVLREAILSQDRRSSTRKREILFSFLQRQSAPSTPADQLVRRLCILREVSQAQSTGTSGAQELLLSQLRQLSAQSENDGSRQSALCGWRSMGTVSQRVSISRASGTSTRQATMPIMQHDNRAERQTARRTPHRLRQRSQRAIKSDNALPMVSWEATWNGRAETGVEVLSVRCIEPIPTPQHVYNLCIAEDHNYYANGILVHNCIDDPHPIEQKRSDLKRETVLDWFLNTWYSRLNDETTGRMIVVGQRVHDQDVSGLILSGATGQDWVHLNLAAEYEPGSACRTYFPVSGKTWEDPRTEEGELLWKEKFPRAVIEQKKRLHGPLGFASIYQQRPVPAGGNIYKEKDRRFFTIDTITQSYLLETPRGRVTVPIADCWNLGVIDLAASTRTSADFFCFETWAVTPYKDALLLHCIHDHLEFPEQQDKILTEFQRFHHSVIAIDKPGMGLPMIQTCVRKGLPIKPFEPQADKVVRSTTGSIYYSNGKAYHLKDLLNLAEIEKELFTFPKAPHDDIADCHAMMALVVPMVLRPGVIDLDNEETALDTTLSIEHLKQAEAITEEQKRIAEEEARAQEQELFKRGPQINPFAWAAEHEGGSWE